MPASNLTRHEAAQRADIVSSLSYSVHLNLTTDDGFRAESVVRFAAAPGASTFLELVSDQVHAVTLNGMALDPAAVSDGTRLHLTGLEATHELVEELVVPLLLDHREELHLGVRALHRHLR